MGAAVTNAPEWRFHPIDEAALCVVIPTYNNAATLRDVVERTWQCVRRIIVVNDGSTDATAAILAELQRELPIEVVTFPANRGKGCALVAGFRKARELGCRFAVTIDSDGQHYPEEIPRLIEAAAQHPDAIIVGSRDLAGKEISGGSLFANRFSNFWLAVQTGRRLSDTQSGFRLYPLHRLRGLGWITSRYEAELELLVYAFWHGVQAVPVPVSVYYPPRAERVSHFRPGRDFLRISLLNTFLCFGAGFYGYPRRLLVWLWQLLRSLYALLYFTVGSFFLTLGAHLYFLGRKNRTEKKRRYHGLLQRLSTYIATHIPGVRYRLSNPHGERFEKPAVLICNHQSYIDLMFTMMTTPNLVVLSNDWGWNNCIFGQIIRYADFFPASRGMEAALEHLRPLVAQGYSVLVFPEGTRSEDCSIRPFHKGAFYLAEQLQLDLLPLVLYGSGFVLPKRGTLLRPGRVLLEVGERVAPDDPAFGTTFRSRTRRFEQWYRERLAAIHSAYVNGREEKL